jgi:hypothetical protein
MIAARAPLKALNPTVLRPSRPRYANESERAVKIAIYPNIQRLRSRL